MIRVLYQGQDNRWQDFKSESENFASPSELLTHATMSPEKIAVADSKSPDKGEGCFLSCEIVADLRNKKVPCFLQRTIAKGSFECIDSAWISSAKV